MTTASAQVDNLTWRWIFYVNVSIGLIALTAIAIAFQAPGRVEQRTIDVLGAAPLAGGDHVDRAAHEPRRHHVRIGVAEEHRAGVLGPVLVVAFFAAERSGRATAVASTLADPDPARGALRPLETSIIHRGGSGSR